MKLGSFFSISTKNGVDPRSKAKGVTFKISPSVEKGFRIGEKDKNYYYDFTDDALVEALKTYLNPKLLKILDSG